MELTELKNKIELDLKKQLVPSHILLDNLRVIDESSRKTSAYMDPQYLPFYYYLSKYLQPVNLLEIGFGLGFFSSCFLKGCNTVKNLLVFQQKSKDFYSNKLGVKNIKSVYKNTFIYYEGNLTDVKYKQYLNQVKWDLCLFNEEREYDKHILALDSVWDRLNDGGTIVMDYIDAHADAKDAFDNFCKIKNIKPIKFDTRYGTGIIKK